MELFITKLPLDTTEENLVKLLSAYGSVGRVEICQHQDGTAKGYAFLELHPNNAELKVTDILNESDLFVKKVNPGNSTWQ